MKTFLITGASSGIGAATARRAREAGYRLVLAARSIDKLNGLVDELGGSDHAIAVQCDVTSDQDQYATAGKAVDAFGSIDVVFANAGIGASAPGTAGGDPENWKQMILANIYGAIMTCKATLPAIRESKGHILLPRISQRLGLRRDEVGGYRLRPKSARGGQG